MNRVHNPTKLNGCIEYEQNLLNTVGWTVVTRVGPKHQLVY